MTFFRCAHKSICFDLNEEFRSDEAAHLDHAGRGLFGPVAKPEGGYGIGVLELDDRLDPSTIGNAHPAIKANAGFSFEVHLMPRAMVRGR
jgi:hypothetical protein